MAELTTVNPNAAPGAGEFINKIVATLRRGEIALALAVVSILVVLILPMPTWLLDMSLAL